MVCPRGWYTVVTSDMQKTADHSLLPNAGDTSATIFSGKNRVGRMNQSWPFPENLFDAVTIVWGNSYIADSAHFANEDFRVSNQAVCFFGQFWLEIPFGG